MDRESQRNPLCFMLLLLHVFFPVGSSLSFDFPSFNQSTPKLLTLVDAKCSNQAIQLTTGSVAYPKPIRLSDPTKQADFTTHFSFKFADTCSCSGDCLKFFLSPYPYTDTSKNQMVAVECVTSRNKADHSTCHVGIDTGSTDSPQSADCKGGITSGGTSNAKVSYISSTRMLTVIVVHDPSATNYDKVWLSQSVDLGDILPNEVAVGFSAATGDSSVKTHEILSWNFSSTLLDPDLPSAAPAPTLAQPLKTSQASADAFEEKVTGKLNLLTGLVGTNLGAVMAVIGTGSLALGYKFTITIKHRKDGRCMCGLDDSSKKELIRAVKVAVQEELQSGGDGGVQFVSV